MSTIPENALTGQKAVVVGGASSGQAAARLLVALGANVTLLDRNQDALPDSFRTIAEQLDISLQLGAHTTEQFLDADLVVMSPGVPLSKITPLLPTPTPEVIGEVELACRYIRKPILAITGTNGKTTAVNLAADMLKQAGKKVFLGGNIGTPVCEYLINGDTADILVLELSSFQLQTCNTFRPWAAALLNFSPNHLDYHEDMEEYLQAKLQMFAHQTEDDLAVFPEEMRDEIEKRAPTKARTIFYTAGDRFVSNKLLGAHNQANMEAAYQICRFFGVTEAEAQLAIKNYELLPHRLITVGEINGVRFVNDSKATTVEALRAALQCFDKPIRLLAGGVFKGGDLIELSPLMKGRVASIGLFGGSEEIFRQAWNGDFTIFHEETLEQAVKRHYREASPGDVILLSPATSSFDQYKSYKARGQDFKRIVGELE